MKITTRITLGLFLVTALTIAALAHQLTVVEKLQGINRELSLTKLEAARISLRLLQRVDGVQEFVAKSVILGDADYVHQWAEWEEAVEEDLIQLRALDLSGAEDDERARVAEVWDAYRRTAAPLRAAAEEGVEDGSRPGVDGGGEPGSPPGGGAGAGALPADEAGTAGRPEGAALPVVAAESSSALEEVDRLLESARTRLATLMSLTDASVAAHVRSSAEAGDRAQLVSRIAAGSAVLLAALICILLYLSISGPLRNLTGGTRELAQGHFDHRLEVRGDDELSELARAFNRMARRLNELEELKRDFVSHVSHELKGPLAAIHETILILLDEIPGPVNEKQAHFLKLSHRSSERLSAMISNLLEVSRLEAGGAEYHARRHDLDAIARSVLEEYEPVARERRIGLCFSSEVTSAGLVCDEDRIREVVANLVGNAIKFSLPEGRVHLTLSETNGVPRSVPRRRIPLLREESPPFLLLSVEDEGVGISDAHKEGVFEKFHQVKVEGRIHGQGVGLGLSISRQNVEGHGGAIWVEDGPERGSIFRTLLPRAPSRWKEESPWEDVSAATSGCGTPTPPPEYTRG